MSEIEDLRFRIREYRDWAEGAVMDSCEEGEDKEEALRYIQVLADTAYALGDIALRLVVGGEVSEQQATPESKER